MRASYRYLFLTLCLLAIAYPASGVEPAKENEACVALAEGDLRIVIATGPLSKDEDISPVRFDRSARIISLQLAGVEYLGAEGMPDDFGLHGIGILGFDEASPGEPFIKPGVGLLRKEGALYRFMRSYELISAFPTRVLERTDTTLTLEQTSSELHGYAYRYTKTYRLHLPSTLVLEYSLTNVGSRSFAFEQYNHNWFSLGLNHPDTSLIIQWPGLHPERTHSWFSEDSDGLRLMENLAGNIGYTLPIPESALTNAISIWTDLGDRGVSIETDFKPNRALLFMNQDGICPELFFYAAIDPGETASWTRTYRLH